jgi:hypothetical protein
MASDEQDARGQQSQHESRSWTAVLADVEADIRRTEQLLAAPAAPLQSLGAPAEVTWAELPAFQSMPAVPAELAERIHQLRAQIVALQAEIKAEMAQWRASCAARRPGPLPSTAPGSFFMDRLV